MHPPLGSSARRINRLGDALGAATYLEVGVFRGETLRDVSIPYRVGIDPRFRIDVQELADERTVLVESTSDDYFRHLDPEIEFDVVFLDGLHTFEQTYRDLCAVLSHAHRRTVILLDDTFPTDPWSAIPDIGRSLRLREQAGLVDRAWHGDVYKVVLAIHSFHPALDFRTLMGPGNPQTLVWRGRLADERYPPLSIDQVARMSYFDLLEMRHLMRESTEEEAIAACLGALGVH